MCKRASILGAGFARLSDARFSEFTNRQDKNVGWVFRLSRHRHKLPTFDDTSASREFRAPARGKAESAYWRPGIRKRRPVSRPVRDYGLPKIGAKTLLLQINFFFLFFKVRFLRSSFRGSCRTPEGCRRNVSVLRMECFFPE